MKIAILGYGSRAKFLIKKMESLDVNVEIVAISDQSTEYLQALSSQGLPVSYSIQEFIQNSVGVDLIMIC